MTIDVDKLPRTLLTSSTRLEEAIDIGFGMFLERIVPPFPELMDPAEAPVEFLPYLAADRGVSEWDPEAIEVEKRDTVALSWATKRQAGTGLALENAVRGLQLTPEVTPWYDVQPKGRPYSFEVRAFADGAYSAEMDARLDRRLADAKSERDTITVTIGQRVVGKHYIGASSVCSELCTVLPYSLPGLTLASPTYRVSVTCGTEKTTVYPLE